MSFLTSLDVRVLDDCAPLPKLMLLEPLHYQSAIVGTVVIPRFYVFDGASVPSGPLGAIAGASGISPVVGIRAACVHDYLLDMKVARRTCDDVYEEALQDCGVSEGTVMMMAGAVKAYTALLESKVEENEIHHGA